MIKETPAIEGGVPVRDSFLVFGQPDIGESEINAVSETLKSKWIGTGPKTEKFQSVFGKYVSAPYALATNSCTSALHLALIASGIKEGDEVITTPMTFCATANVIIHAGGKPVFSDINTKTLNIDEDKIEQRINEKTKAILPVHFAGRPCNMDKICHLAEKYKLTIIEDAAHAIETFYKDKKIGSIGDFTCFSFYATKNITTVEGGIVTSKEPHLHDKMKIMGLHGMSKDAWKRYSDEGYKHYDVIYPGFKYNMTDIQASIGLSQMSSINENYKKRIKLWEHFDEAFSDMPIIKLNTPDELGKHARHLYILILDTDQLKVGRDKILSALTAENIGVGVHYMSLHKQHYYKNIFNLQDDDFPAASFISDRTISIPFGSYLSEKDSSDVISSVRKILTYYRK